MNYPDNMSASHISSQLRSFAYAKISETIGHTPLTPVDALDGVWLKEEFRNPGGSHYDRAYLPTLLHLETTGIIRPGDNLRDITSGSAGISLARLGQQLGYEVRILVPDELPDTRVQPMHDAGAEVVRTGTGYIQNTSKSQRQEIRELLSDTKTWRRLPLTGTRTKAVVIENIHTGQRICWINHSENPLTVASFRNIGHEVVAQMTRQPEAVLLAIGNGTTIVGIGSVIKERWPATRLVGYSGNNDTTKVENFGTITAGTSVPLGYQQPAFDMLDDVVTVSADQRDDIGRRVNTGSRRLGRSSLMGLVAAEGYPGAEVVAFGYDTMDRY